MFFLVDLSQQLYYKFQAYPNAAFCTCQCITVGTLHQKLVVIKECPQRKLCIEFKSSSCRSFVTFRSVQCQWHSFGAA